MYYLIKLIKEKDYLEKLTIVNSKKENKIITKVDIVIKKNYFIKKEEVFVYLEKI